MYENSPHWLIYLNTWYQSVELWERIGDVALLEEVCHWGQTFKVSKDSGDSKCLLALSFLRVVD